MPIVVAESYSSPQISIDVEKGTAEIKFLVEGTDDPLAASAALVEAVASEYSGMALQTVEITRKADFLFDGAARYGTRERKQPGEAEFSFDTGGGTQHISNSLSTTGKFAPAGQTAPDYKQLIGVTADSVEGVDVQVPAFSYTVTRYMASGDLSTGYVSSLYSLTGCVNTDTVNLNVDGVQLTFNAGELLFMGASGRKRGQDDWEVTLHFSGSQNRTNFTVGDITIASKLGWEYLWIRYEDRVDANAKKIVKVPIAAYVEKVYHENALSGLLS
ncbi:MAG TPA: hypothetical protein VHZ24_15630 [Pirellulales bacterium]|nr:hypothetical protein [Pirellulales bacterium]